MAVTIALFALGGIWLDGKLGSSPIATLVATLVGVAGGMLHLVSVLAPEQLPWRRRSRPPPFVRGAGTTHVDGAGDASRDTDTRPKTDSPHASDSGRDQDPPPPST